MFTRDCKACVSWSGAYLGVLYGDIWAWELLRYLSDYSIFWMGLAMLVVYRKINQGVRIES